MKISPRAQAELKVGKARVAKDDAIVSFVIQVAGVAAADVRVFERQERGQGRQ
jgi:hypothetical protein